MRRIILFLKAFNRGYTYTRGGKVVRVEPFTDRRVKRATASGKRDDRTGDLFGDAGPTIDKPLQQLIDDHEKVINALESPSKAKREAAADEQKEHLADYRKQFDQASKVRLIEGAMNDFGGYELGGKRYIGEDADVLVDEAREIAVSTGKRVEDVLLQIVPAEQLQAGEPVGGAQAERDPVTKGPTKAQQTRARRRAVLDVLGEGWKAQAGVDGARDAYKKVVTRPDGSKVQLLIMPEKTVDGNFYVGAYNVGGARPGAGGNGTAQTLEEAKLLAEKFAGAGQPAATRERTHSAKEIAWAKQTVANPDYLPWADVRRAREILGIPHEGLTDEEAAAYAKIRARRLAAEAGDPMAKSFPRVLSVRQVVRMS